jgi:hypothetical protein
MKNDYLSHILDMKLNYKKWDNTMLKNFIVMLAAFMTLSVSSQDSIQAQSRATMKNDFGIELLGKAALYSFSYQRMVNSKLGLQAGIAGVGGAGSGIGLFPIGAKFYFLSGNASPFLAGGIVGTTAKIETGPNDLKGSSSYGYVGPGFEFRSPTGFLFRGSLYALFAGQSFLAWPGLHIGYAW